MTKADLEEMIVKLVIIAKRNETGWERHFSESEEKALRKIWNHGLSEWDRDYWR